LRPSRRWRKKRALLERATQEHAWIVLEHDPDTALARPVADGDDFTWPSACPPRRESRRGSAGTYESRPPRMLHHWFAAWMQFVHDQGYLGVFVMMAAASTVLPLPAEVVVPPAAYWATQGSFSFWGVVLASTLGSWTGSSLSYLVARWLGRPLILRYGRYFFVPEKKWLLAESWINHYSVVGIFFGRLLPLVRHVVSLPQGPRACASDRSRSARCSARSR